MSKSDDRAVFTFSWLALRLLGKGLYSNPWSALSELVANGLDAEANAVYVYVDARDKSRALIEVIDNGSGMSRADIDTYVKVGHNKRLDNASSSEAVKGRKGIGKLAALFLSSRFYILTKQAGEQTSWELDAREGRVQDDESPELNAIDSPPRTANDELWSYIASGTRLILTAVDLTGYGSQSVAGLGSRLANQFTLLGREAGKIYIAVEDGRSATSFEPVEKSVAYGNFASTFANFTFPSDSPIELRAPLGTVKVPAEALPGGVYETARLVSPFPRRKPEPPDDEAWREIESVVDLKNQTYMGRPFKLEGWIGVHATISGDDARVNDTRFVKNKYYNPAQVRVYVRGKLATEHLLGQLGLTGTYVNYIEGEISFDILDDNSLTDIATSNRQDFDETDGRVTLLRALVRPIVRSLINERQKLASTIAELQRAERERRETTSKQVFSRQVAADLEQHPELSENARAELQMVITNKIQGDVRPKQQYKVFISHASKDERFATFIDEVLRARGIRANEIFYTSRVGAVGFELNEESLAAQIRECITDANTKIFYLTSKNFLGSQYCLFEGGAGWATRGASEYLKLNMEYESIPAFLTNGKSEIKLIGHDGQVKLTPEVYSYLVDGVFNPMIAHVNEGREIAGDDSVELFPSVRYPSLLELHAQGKTHADFFDTNIQLAWLTLVAPTVADYLVGYQAD